MCKAVEMRSGLLGATSSLPTPVLIAIGVGGLIVGVALGILVGRRFGQRGLAQRLVALGNRLGAGATEDDFTIEGALSYLEQVTGAATEAVTDSSADAIRLRRSLDTLPLGLVLCDESGSVIYRNAVASAMMESRGGDALAAQAVTDLLATAWDKGSAEKTLDLYGPPRRTLGVHATLIDDGRRPLGVIAVIDLGDGGQVSRARIVVFGATDAPLVAHEAGALAVGRAPAAIDANAVGKAAAVVAPFHSDLHASATYKQELVQTLTCRAIAQALAGSNMT